MTAHRPKDRSDTEAFDVQRQLHNELRTVCVTVEGILSTPARVIQGLHPTAKARGVEAVEEAIAELEALKAFLSRKAG